MTVHSKFNTQHNDALLKEAEGLQALTEAVSELKLQTLRVPQVYSVSPSELKLHRIESVSARPQQMEDFGRELATLHLASKPEFGWHQDNFIGLSPQRNGFKQDWGEFFIEYRLLPQIDMVKSKATRERFLQVMIKNRQTLSDYLSRHCAFPSFVHGDMWSGNVLFDSHYAWLIDPAVYWGDCETDIAMTEMFGGFSREFYDGYRRGKRLSEAYPVKRQIYNLYHYLNHMNLFGTGYLPGCEQGFAVIEGL